MKAALTAIGREAARRFRCDRDDAIQEARLVAWKKHEAGLPLELVVRYTRQTMLSPERSPLRPEASSTRSRTDAEDPPRIGGFRSPLTNGQVRALARLCSSAFGGILARVEATAPMTCPGCGGRGYWGSRWNASPKPDGAKSGECVENEREARERWPLYEAPRKARDDQVWWCRRCGGWTWDPVAHAVEAHYFLGGDTMRVRSEHVGVDGEALLVRYVAAGRRDKDLHDDDDEAFPLSTRLGSGWNRAKRHKDW